MGRERAGALGNGLKERARTAATRIRPARQHRLVGEQTELTGLEDAVLDAFLADEVLSERGIDVGAISRGIVELSGSGRTEREADRAVEVAQRVRGVQTVVDRLDVEDEEDHFAATARDRDLGDGAAPQPYSGSRSVGMGARRQGRETDPDQPDDSQRFEERALHDADRDQWMDEGYAAKSPRTTATEDPVAENRTRFRDDELDNQDPHRAGHADYTLDEQPQAHNPEARVGEGAKPGIELRLEQADVPTEPREPEEQGGA
jgi:hypothetical protein